jgi:hypothetical protein
VVDQPEALVPEEQVRILCGPVHVRHERVEPHDLRRERGIDSEASGRRVGGGARQEVEPEVLAPARREQLLDLRVGLGQPQRRVDLDQHLLRNGESKRSSELSHEHLGHERARPLPGAAELDHIQTVVLRLEQPWQRAALAQRHRITRGRNTAQARHSRHARTLLR